MAVISQAEPAIFEYTSVVRKLFSALVFPVTLVVMMSLYLFAIAQGWHLEGTLLVLSLSTAVLVIGFEYIHPHAKLWQESKGDVPTDALHMLLSEVAPHQIFSALFHTTLLAGAAWLAGFTGFSLWPSEWPLVAQLVLALIIGELPYYWWHRMCHSRPLLWRLHATHHSAERLYFLNAGRFHPLDTFTGFALQISPLLLLGCNAETMALFTLFVAIHGLFQHANIEVRLGPLNYIFSMSELHRWHHSQNLEDANANYGGNIILWDIVFGTRHFPKDRQHHPEDVGFHGMPNFPKTYLGQLASPFVWNKLKAEAEKDKVE